MARTTLTFVLLATLSLAGVGTGASIDETLSLSLGEWAAITVPVPTDVDPQIRAEFRTCSTASESPAATVASAAFAIVDGVPHVLTIGTGASRWTVGSEPGSAGLVGSYVQPTLIETGSERCERTTIGESALTTGATSELTILLFSASPRATVNFSVTNADSTIRSGGGIALTKNHFEAGIHANTYPMGMGLSAGALLEESQESPNGSIGWFWPQFSGSLGTSDHTCHFDQDPCSAAEPNGLQMLASTTSGTWRFTITNELQPLETPYYVLGLAELEPGMIR